MPNSIQKIRSTVTTHRSNSTAAFFDLPTDATPQDCKEISIRLIEQCRAVLVNIYNSPKDQERLSAQLELMDSLLFQATNTVKLIDIEKAVDMAMVQVEE